MDDNRSMMDLDVNQQSSDSPLLKVPPWGSSLNEHETRDSEIGGRIRFLEAITCRAIQRRRNHHDQRRTDDTSERGKCWKSDSSHLVAKALTSERGKCWKSDSSHLVAKALEMDGEANKLVLPEEEGRFYDCNICSETARTPVLTCCGHLFCWACFYHMSYVDSTSKECPVCEGEVSDVSVIPVYVNGDVASELGSGLSTPPRPKARRVESVRRRLDDVPVAEALRRIRIGIGAMVE